MKMLVSEIKLREMIRSRLLSEISDSDMTFKREYDPQVYNKQKQDFRDSLPKLGRKYSYELNGDPQAVVVMLLGSTEVCTVYSAATIKDPISSGNGKLIPDNLLIDTNPEFYEKFIEKYPELSALELPDADAGKYLYDEYRLFIPIAPKKPRFESTEGALKKSQADKCTYGSGDIKGMLSDAWKVSTGSADQSTKDRVAMCLKEYTIDSLVYSFAQSLLGLIPGIGIGIDIVMDAIPGILIIAYYADKDDREKVAYYTILTLIFIFTPAILSKGFAGVSSKFGKASLPIIDDVVLDFRTGSQKAVGAVADSAIGKLIFSMISMGTIISLSGMITEYLLGSKKELTREQIITAINDLDIKFNGSVNEIIKEAKKVKNLAPQINFLTDPQGLGKKYPPL